MQIYVKTQPLLGRSFWFHKLVPLAAKSQHGN